MRNLMRKTMPLLLALVLAFALSTAASAAGTLTAEVSHDDGATYTETYSSLVDAVAAANASTASGTVRVRISGSETFASATTLTLDSNVRIDVVGTAALAGPLTIDGGGDNGRAIHTIALDTNATLTLTDVTVQNIVSSTSYAAAIRVETGALLVLDGATLKNNQGEIGAVYGRTGASMEFKNATIEGNVSTGTASNRGGVVHMNASSCVGTFTNTTFKNNTAPVRGSALTAIGTLSVTNCTFEGNSGAAPGALHVRGASTAAAITNCTFTGNSSTAANGAALYVEAGAVTVSGMTAGTNAAYDAAVAGGTFGLMGAVDMDSIHLAAGCTVALNGTLSVPASKTIALSGTLYETVLSGSGCGKYAAVFAPESADTDEACAINPRTGVLMTENQNLVVEMGFAFYEKASYTQYQQTRLSGNTSVSGFNKLRYQRREPYLTPGELSAQRLGFFDCSSFVWAVYDNVFDGFENRFYPQTGEIMTLARSSTIGPDYEFVYLRELTSADRNETTYAEIAAEMKAILQPGDIIDYRRTVDTGHALLYVGNDCTIESTGSDYDYATATDKTESAALFYRNVNSFLFKTSGGTGSMFRNNNLSAVTILRPLNGTGLTATDVAKAYAANSGISAIKTALMRGQSAEPGESITYTIKLDNTPANGTAYEQTLTVTDPISDNVTFVRSDSGGVLVDGKVVFADVTVPAAGSKTLTYTVAVKPDASGMVEGTTGNANGIEFKCADILIGEGLGAAQEEALLTALANGKSSGTALSWLNSVYKSVLGKNFGVSTDSVLFSSIFTSLSKNYSFTEDSVFIGDYALYKVNVNESVSGVATALVDNVVGGFGVFSQSQSEHTARLRYLREGMLKVGDVLATVDVDGNYAYYVYRGGDMLKVTDSGTESAVTTTVLDGALACSRFALLRPSMIEAESGEYVAAVNGTLYTSLVDAFAAAANAASATTIEFFGEETFTEPTTLTLNQYTQLEVSGSAALRGSVTIDGQGLTHTVHPIAVASGAALTLSDGVTVTGLVNGGSGSTGGFGALRVGGNLFLDGVTVSNCSGSRGALYSPSGAWVHITDSVFRENESVTIGSTAEQGGAAIFGYGSKTVYVVENTQFIENSSESDGGAVKLVSNATFTLTNCTFTDNIAAVNGGAIDVTQGVLTVNGAAMSGNTTETGANDIYIGTNGTLNLSGTLAIEEIALAEGKAIALGDTLALTAGSDRIAIDGTVDTVVLTGGKVGEYYTLFTGAVDGVGVTSEGKLEAVSYAAQHGENKYERFADALSAANAAGGTVKLLANVGATTVTVKSGVTLDLGGKTLACSYLIGFNGSQIIDSSADKSGAVQCAQNGLTVSANNAQMPIWNGTDGYFFESFDVINTRGSASSGTYTFTFRPEFVTNERETLVGATGGEASGFSIKVLLTWDETDGTSGEKTLVYKDEFVKQVYAENKAFYAYITNYENYVAKNLQIRVAVVSDFGIEMVSEATAIQ